MAGFVTGSKIPLLDRRSHIGDLHLWYLIDDVDSLYQLLRHDIDKWGQLQTLADIGSAEGLTRKSPVYLRAAASARLLEHLRNLRRQGRELRHGATSSSFALYTSHFPSHYHRLDRIG